jgi:DNA-binding MarR family transcriptional regulator
MFDSLIHQPIRTQIIAYLIKHEVMSFKMLKELLDVTDGNLSTHIKKLVEAGYVVEEKFFEGKRPKTNYTITPLGANKFKTYITTLKEFINEEN